MIWNRSMNMHFMLFSLAILSLSTTQISHATTHTLLPNQSICDGQILVSANLTFALGFFTPGNSSSNRYVGIWYHQIPVLTPVWVANRDSPTGDESGVLSFTDDGNLMIRDDRGFMFQFSFGSTTMNNTSATIMDSGNLVLRDMSDGSVLWQSFDHPTDHFLPGMLLGMTGKQNRFLIPWRSSDDPSKGDFYLGANPNGTKQLLIWKGGKISWDTGVWDGKRFSAGPEPTSDYGFDFRYTSYRGDQYLTYSMSNDSILTRCMLDFTGQIKQKVWVSTRQSWMVFWSQPKFSCDVFNSCGDFGVCGADACQCLKGFEPSSIADWTRGVWNAGCFRTTKLYCNSSDIGEKQDGFLAMSDIKFPTDETKLDIQRTKECESACLNNCSCTAYAFTDSCLLWYGKLTTVQQLDPQVDAYTGTLYLRLAASEFEENKRNWIIVVASVTSVSLCVILIGCFLWWRRRETRKLNKEQAILLLGADIANKIGQKDRKDADFTIFDFSHVAEATNNFSVANKLGEGGFGPVYKGMLAEAHEIAVKRLSARSGQGLEEFKNEILLIAKLQHRNLVRLLGCCIQREEKILVYEYMPNKSLDFFLFDKGSVLEWGRRFHIIEGIAQGLLYLHKHSRLRIIHRDLKASNILLDAEMNPKISDFGMARIFSLNETEANTIKVVGTHGYISPEYAAEGLFSIKSDVFSFGVLLLEIVSGKRNSSFHQYMDYVNLLGYAWELWKEGRLLELMDPLLGDNNPQPEISRCLHVGLLCVQESATDRPTMTGVITMLSSENMMLPDPKPPGFFTLRTVAREDLSSNMCGNASINRMTITAIDGR